MKFKAIFGRRGRVILAITTVVAWTLVRHQISQMDGRFFQPSTSGIKGLVLYLAGDYSGAAKAYRDDIQEQYRTLRTAEDPAWDALLRKEYQTAKELSRLELAKDPAAIEPLLTLGQTAIDQGEWTKALDYLNRVLQKKPYQYDALLLSSVAYSRSAMYDKATDSLVRALPTNQTEDRITSFISTLEIAGDLKARPKGERPLCLLAHLYRYLRIFDSSNGPVAIAYAKKAIATGDRIDDAYVTVGVVYHKERKREKAISAMLEAIEVNPRNAEAYDWAGQFYSKRGDIANEYKMEKAAYEISPENPAFVSRYGYVLAEKLGDFGQAVEVAKKALAAQPNNVALYRRIGYLDSYLGNPEEAAEYYRKAVSMEPEDASNHEGLGLILSGLGQNKEAEAEFRRTLALDPTRNRAYIGLGSIYYEKKDLPNAIREYEAAFQNGETDFGQLETLCSLYLMVSEFNKAVPCLEMAVRIDPKNTWAGQTLPKARALLRAKRTR
jgi:tetratricopeptide (TPR) repeat protein